MSVQNPLSRATAPDAEEYHKWRDEFLRSRPGRAAIKELGDLKKYHPDEHDKLLDQVLGECFKASRWAKGTDPFEHRRRSEGAARRKLPRQIEAVQELRRFIKDHPSIANQAIGNGILETGIHVLPDSSTPVEKLLDDALRAYEAGLASPALRSVDMCRYGAVVFPEQLGSKNSARPEAETMLLFELTRMFRAFTRRGAYLWFMRGGADIASGEPHYRIAWHFCTAAIKGEVPAPSDLANSCRRVKDRLRQFLRHNQGILFMGWAQPQSGLDR